MPESNKEDKLQGLILGVLIILGFIIFLALALLKVFIYLAIFLVGIEIVLAIIFVITKEELLEEPLKWIGIAILVNILVIFILYLIGVVFGNSFIGEQSKEVFQLFLNISKPITIN